MRLPSVPKNKTSASLKQGMRFKLEEMLHDEHQPEIV
jgi:hypothetical protein